MFQQYKIYCQRQFLQQRSTWPKAIVQRYCLQLSPIHMLLSPTMGGTKRTELHPETICCCMYQSKQKAQSCSTGTMWFSSWLWDTAPNLHPEQSLWGCIGIHLCGNSVCVFSGLREDVWPYPMGIPLGGTSRVRSAKPLDHLVSENGPHWWL